MSGVAHNGDPSATLGLARQQTRDLLGASDTFRALPIQEQKAMYLDMVKSLSRELAAPQSTAMAGFPLPPGIPGGGGPGGRAADDIDLERLRNRRMDQLGDIASDFIQAVDFPTFVKNLLKGVFDANLAVTVQQMQAYGELLKTATASISKFVNAIDSTAAFGYLAENRGDDFSIDFSDESEDKTPGNPEGMVLVDKDGNKVASSKSDAEVDAEVKKAIMDAKIQMAREQRALLRETLLMGVTRLVVEKGNVRAGVIFDFKATEKIATKDSAARKHGESSSHSGSFGSGFIASIVGGPRGGMTNSSQDVNLTVSSAKGTQDTALNAKLTGNVDITFKADYFKLDNFAQIYGPVTREGGPPAAGGAAPAPGALPTGTGAGAGAGAGAAQPAAR